LIGRVYPKCFFPINLHYMVNLSPQINLILDWLLVFEHLFGLFKTKNMFCNVFTVFLRVFGVEICPKISLFWSATSLSDFMMTFEQGKRVGCSKAAYLSLFLEARLPICSRALVPPLFYPLKLDFFTCLIFF
jgi:hypothetical protein